MIIECWYIVENSWKIIYQGFQNERLEIKYVKCLISLKIANIEQKIALLCWYYLGIYHINEHSRLH